MEVETTLAHSFQKSFSLLWKNNDFCDFTVVVDDTSFQCHRLVLCACSGFFQGLFRSQMKECQENQVKVQEMAASTFDVILNSVYSGVSGLTVDNVLDVWSATEQLQIRYLSEECENFAIKNISVDNCCNIFWHAMVYAAEKVETNALVFISKHFDQVRNREDFLELFFYDFLQVIESDFLITSSEDLVVETVLKWVDYSQHDQIACLIAESDSKKINTKINQSKKSTESKCKKETSPVEKTSTKVVFTVREEKWKNNVHSVLTGTEIDQTDRLSESVNDSHKSKSAQPMPEHCLTDCQNFREDRQQDLFTLMSTCRLCLISSSCLDNLLHTPAILSCKEAFNLVTEAMMYKLCAERRHETWPEAATHRVTSDMKHAMVFMSNNKLLAYNLISGSVQEFADLPADFRSHFKTIVFDNVLYLGYVDHYNRRAINMFVKEKCWVPVSYPSNDFNLLAHGRCIYFFIKHISNDSSVFKLNSEHGHCRDLLECCVLNASYDSFVVSFQHFILVLRPGSGSDSVLYFNTETMKTHTSPSCMNGTSKGMISFTHLGDVFLLQRNGSLWKVCWAGKDSVDFELVSKLWDKDIDLKGCVVYRRELFVFYGENDSTGETYLDSVSELFRKIKLVPFKSDSSCVPMVLPQSWLIVKDSKA